MKIMNKLLKVHPRAVNKIIIFMFIIFALSLALLIISIVSYSKSENNLNYFEENDPDIDLTGLSSFSFISHTPTDYSPSISNLGTTGNIIFDCYRGKCYYTKLSKCKEKVCSFGKCKHITVPCNVTYDELFYSCSSECREKGSSYCYSCPSNATKSEGTCSRERNDSYNISKSCQTDNLIYYWKGLFYERINATEYGKYSYLKNAIQKDESCPEGKKMCGILDELGNKLCFPLEESCPINYIKESSEMPQDNLNYAFAEIENKKIYFTNESVSTGKIVGGIFADSDLLKKYKEGECVTLDTSNISEFINNNNKLYRDVLNYDPYNDKDVDSKGKSYLKWCIPGYGKIRDLNIIKETNAIYLFNKTVNTESIKPIKDNYSVGFAFSLVGFFVFCFFLGIFLFCFLSKNGLRPNLCCCVQDKGMCFILVIAFLLLLDFFMFNILSSVHLLNCNDYLIEGKGLKVGFITDMISLNRMFLWGSIILFLLIIIFFYYIYTTPENDNGIVNNNGSDQNNNNSDFPYKDINKMEPLNNEGSNNYNGHDTAYNSSDYN